MDKKLLILSQWVGALLGIAGTFLLASHTKFSGYGFVCYLISNIGWVYFGIKTKNIPMLFMQAVYTVLSLFGFYRYFIG
jgi:hypothetical protein